MSLSSPDDACYDLLCGEDPDGVLAEEPPEWPLVPEFPDDSDESMSGFVESESDHSPGLDYPDRFRSSSLDPLARGAAISWILKVQSYYRFRPLTAYLSVNYMDRFLSSHHLPQANGWPLQLLAVSCLSLAAKIEETLVPSLLDLQVEDARFVFEPQTICKMELLILTVLNWRLQSVTPFTFIDFFAHKANLTGKYARFLVHRATQIILITICDTEFLSHYPSSVAAAAIVYAAENVADLDLIDPGTAVKWCTGLTEEGITNCWQAMKRVVATHHLEREPPKISPPIRVSMASGSSCSCSPPPSKRRKPNNKCPCLDGAKELENNNDS